MSDRLVSADKAKEVLKHLLYETALSNDGYIMDIYEDIIENRLDTWIELIPTAEPMRHGHWINTGFLTAKCSECDTEVHELEYGYYCPNCGAKMDEPI